jgi:two-component system NtrC family sensor kinase
VSVTRGAEKGRDGSRPAGRPLPSLGFRLLGGLLVLLFVAFFTVIVTAYIGLEIGLPRRQLGLSLILIAAFDLLMLGAFGNYRLRRLVLDPVGEMVHGSERIADGDRQRLLPRTETAELERLSSAVNAMATTLLENQELLAENVRSLDATNRELSEARSRLVRAEKLASIGRLAAGVAHEVGNPLGAIIGYLELGRRRGSTGEWVDGIAYETQRIDRIVRGLMEYAKPKTAAGRAVDLNATVRRTVEMMELQGRFKRARLDLALAEVEPVRGDESQIEQVLVNLLLNAADAIDDRGGEGTIEVSTRNVNVGGLEEGVRRRRRDDPDGVDYAHLRRFDLAADPGPTPGLRAGDPAVELRVRDDGVGIPPELRGRVFEPFFSTKEPGRGTGLGLAVSARLIEGMGGIIEALPGEGSGAVLRILLPRTERNHAT